MHAKLHEKRYPNGSVRSVFAACDSHLIGKILEEGELYLDLKLYGKFYGEKVSETEFLELLYGADSLNLVGKEVIDTASKMVPIDSKKARTINGVPHLQVYKV